MGHLASLGALVAVLTLAGLALPPAVRADVVTVYTNADALVDSDPELADEPLGGWWFIGAQNGYSTRYAYLNFDLSGIPAGSIIQTATLWTNCFSYGGTIWPTINVHQLTGTFDEATVTWNSGRPSFSPTVLDSRAFTGHSPSELEWQSWNVKGSWSGGGNVGFALVSVHPDAFMAWFSRESEANSPAYLDITYTQGTSVPEPASLSLAALALAGLGLARRRRRQA